MPDTKLITYKDFSGGDWGEIGQFRAPANTFSGSNVVLYTNGMLGPRAGLHENTYSGTMQGEVHGIYLVGKIGKPLMIFAGDQVYSTTEDNFSLGTVTSAATLTAEPTENVIATWYDPNGNIFFTSPGEKTYYLDWTTDTLTDLLATDSGTVSRGTETMYLCRDRLYAAGDGRVGGAGGQFVYVSAAADFTNFVGGETFEVGYFNSVRSIIESQNSLMFSTIESTNNIGSGVGWYSLVGATPQGDLRRVNTQVATEEQLATISAEGGNVYFWSGWTTAATDEPYLVQTNGAKFDDQSFRHLRLGGTQRSGYYNAPDQTLLYISDENDGWMRCNGAWSKVNFEVDIAPVVCPTEAGSSFLLPYGETGVDVKVYELVSRPGQPGFPGLQQNPGDNSTVPLNSYFYLPAYQSDTKEVRVRRVIVDFMKWDTDHTGGNNEFVVNVITYGQHNLPSGTTDGSNTTTATWSESQAEASGSGTLDRYVARIGQQGKAAAFQIGITGIKGVAIESITVEFDEDDMADGRTK